MGQGWQQEDYDPACAIYNQTGDVTQNEFLLADWVLCCDAAYCCVAVNNINLRGILWNVNAPDF
jgi:hypothetical protein